MDIKQVRSLGPSQKSWKWKVQLPSISGISSEEISKLVEEIPELPIPEITASQEHAGTRMINLPEMQIISSFSVVFFLGETTTVYDYVNLWRELIRTKEGLYNYPSNYKKDITATLLNGKNEKVVAFNLIRAFPTVPSGLSLTSGGSERLRLTVPFAIDQWKQL